MTIETAQTINELNTSYPRATDLLREGDDHIRMVKATLQRTFPRIDGTVNFSASKLNVLDSISDVSGGSMKITVPTSSPDVSAGTHTSGKSGVLRLLTNTDREVNFSIPQNRVDTVVTSKTANITTWDLGKLNLYNVNKIFTIDAEASGIIHLAGRGNQIIVDNGYDAGGGNRNSPFVTVHNGPNNNNQRFEAILSDNGTNMLWHQVITNGTGQAYMTFNDKGRLDVNGPGAGGIHTGGPIEANGNGEIGGILHVGNEIRAYNDIYTGYGQGQTVRLQRDGNIVRTGSQNSIFDSIGNKTNLSESLSWLRDRSVVDIFMGGTQGIHYGQTGSAQSIPSGGAVVGYHQGMDGQRWWLENLYWRNIWKTYTNGNQIIGMQ